MSDLSAIAVEVCAHRYATEAGPWDTRLATIEDLMHDLDDAEVRETLRDIAALAIGGMREIDATKGGESRPAEQVAADIAGDVVGVGGMGCEPVSVRPRPIAKLRCFWTLRREREGVEDAKRRARVAPFYHEGVAPRAPEEA